MSVCLFELGNMSKTAGKILNSSYLPVSFVKIGPAVSESPEHRNTLYLFNTPEH